MNEFSYRDLFVPLMGLIPAVIATVSAVLIAIFGPFEKLRLPVESVPGTSRGFLNVVLFAPFLICFFSVAPDNARLFLYGAIVPMLLAVLCYQSYGSLLGLHRFTKPAPRRLLWRTWIREEVVIGGTKLTPSAQAAKTKRKQTEQELLASAEYKADEIWTRESRVTVQTKIERWYFALMLCSLLTVVAAALAGQTLLSDEAPLDAARRLWIAFVGQGVPS